MMETRNLREKWQLHRQQLLRAEYNLADEQLARALHFADNRPLISSVIAELRSTDAYRAFNAEAWLAGRGPANTLGAGRTNLGFSYDDKESNAQCLKVLERAVALFENGSDGLFNVGITTYGGSGSRIDDCVQSAVATIFDPFFHYVDSELRAQETLISPVDIMRDVQQLVDTDAGVKYAETHQLLREAYRQLYAVSESGSESTWNQVGYACRHVLVTFATEVFDPAFVPDNQNQPKGDDAENKLKWVARYWAKAAKIGDTHRTSLEYIIRSNWKFVNTVGHRQESATERDARLAVIYTYLTVWLIDDLITNKKPTV